MYDKYGEFDSAAELNVKAFELKSQDDEKALIELAMENGIPIEDAEDYMDGCINDLCTPISAAVGKLKMEAADLKLSGVLMDWTEELIEKCLFKDGFCYAVRKKGKDLAGFIALTAEEGYEKRCVVDRRIVNKARKIKDAIGAHEFSIGIPDKKTRTELAMKYYMG